MPFVYDQTEIELPKDDSDPPPPRADEFVYIPAPEFGGAAGTVRFSVPAPGTPIEPPQPPAPTAPQSSYEERRQQSERLHEQRRQQLFAVVIPVLREIGARRAYCRYDGGNDEGFSWLDNVEMQDGARIGTDALEQRLSDVQLMEKLYAAGMMKRTDHMSEQEHLKSFVRYSLCDEWATMLLGSGYGTGEYSMYGAFTVDLEACTISDDPDADPVVKNIEIAE
jgi:hypothetical protein